MIKQKILITGGNGLVGSRVIEQLCHRFDFISPSSSEIDITDKNSLEKALETFTGEYIIHAAAFTDVDACEKDQKKAWEINVEGTRNICKEALSLKKKVIFVSTDFVFSGTKEFYTEEDSTDPVNYYGKTKAEAERIVLQNPVNLIVRISFPYRAHFERKMDFVAAIKSRLEKKESIQAPSDNLSCPTFIDDIAHILENLITTKQTGIFHVNGASVLSSYTAACMIAKEWGFSTDLIAQITFAQMYQNRARRPLQLRIKHDKIIQLGLQTRTFEEGLKEIKNQV